MSTQELSKNWNYAHCADLAERELASFIGAVTELFGLEQARLSIDDWLDEAELVETQTRDAGREWRAVSVAAAARLANRLNVALHTRTLLRAPLAVIDDTFHALPKTSTSILN